MAINANADFQQLSDWLNEKLSKKNSLIPHIDIIPTIQSKGIYFWFMNSDGYEALSRFIEITPILLNYSYNIEGKSYDLVYLGTTGTGKQGKSTLTKRLKWHINQKHSESSIISGTLSTLRQGIGSLVSDDLIAPDTENKVNYFIKEYIKVFWIEYPNNKQLIDSDEEILIKIIRPLLNLKSNPNALKDTKDNSTKKYKERRNTVKENTKHRLGFEKNKTEKVNVKYDSFIVKNDCQEFKVLQNQSAFEIIRNYTFPMKQFSISIFDSFNPSNFICQFYDKTTIPNRYFGNPDTNKARLIENKNPARWKVIQNQMIEERIPEIIIKLCPINN